MAGLPARETVPRPVNLWMDGSGMRIIAGEFRGRKLLGPEGLTTRPITDRVKESLFAALHFRMPEARVADLFCGTGSLGLEALSRGAEHAWFAERDASALTQLGRNIEALGVQDRATVWRGDIVARLGDWLAGLPEELDVAFLDPPFALARDWPSDEVERQLFAPLAENLAADGLLVYRTPRDVEVEAIGPFATVKRKVYGVNALHFMEAAG